MNLIDSLRDVLSQSLDRVIADSYFHAPDVLKGTVAAYIDTVQYVHQVAFRFPDIDEERLMDRLHGLGLYLENMGLMNVALNPHHSALAKFGTAIRRHPEVSNACKPLSDGKIAEIKRSLLESDVEGEAFRVVARSFISGLESAGHEWLAQQADAWEVENNRKKLNSTYFDSGHARRIEKALTDAGESVLRVVRQHVEPNLDVSTFLDVSYRPLYCVHSNQAGTTYPEDLVAPLKQCKSPLIDIDKAMELIYMLVLEDRIGHRNLRPGNREAPELKPLRSLLMGQGILKVEADRKALMEQAFEEGKAKLKGQPDTLHKTFERSYEESSRLLLEGKIDEGMTLGDHNLVRRAV